ncbi:hypothetical protein FIBSPDRAFT_853584 [Athelia psychrophila]|uniref:Uncharacterized protein n=1 Tax=Athelia psychrophila TaxID=1759441 RepID=A0A166QNG3_9AGAM|nr:hypothetical protein FIBSPDRAFT_873447 [Fibularhizoctonia sp. CBS 109695]KZP27362.1 hypothetical protein FIBSPDRAFT_853584 [Fibularhizoctonia sp. CBS 109695]
MFYGTEGQPLATWDLRAACMLTRGAKAATKLHRRFPRVDLEGFPTQEQRRLIEGCLRLCD